MTFNIQKKHLPNKESEV